MTPDMALSIDSALPLFSNTKSPSPPQDDKSNVSPIAGPDSPKEKQPLVVDTVSISSQSRQAITDIKKEKTLFEEAKKVDANVVNSYKADKETAKVEFVYDLKGDLVTKYLDSASRLIYQTPSELMLRLKSADSNSNSSVSTKA